LDFIKNMLELIKNLSQRFFRSKLVIGSFILTVGTLVGGLGNYFYHLLMGRMLGPTDYGVLVSLISLSYILSVPIGTLNIVIIKFVSTFKGKKEMGAVGTLFKSGVKKVLPFSLLILFIFLVLTPLITSFLHLNSSFPFIIILGAFFISVFSAINRAVLQGLLRFKYISLSNVLEIGLKLIIAVLLVFAGLKVNGALLGFLIAGIFTYFFTFYPLRFLLGKTQKKINFDGREVFNFALPVLFSTLAFTSLYTSDVLLVRHFFPDQQTGLYAALSTLGKIIYFLTGPIIAVMFPMISERHANGGVYKNLLLASLAMVGIVCLFITSAYFLFPTFIIKTLFGSQYILAVPYLGFFGIFLSLYSLSCLLTNFYLSIKETKVALMPVLAAGFQIILIWLFHKNFGQIIWISIGMLSLLLLGLLLYYPQHLRKRSQIILKNEK